MIQYLRAVAFLEGNKSQEVARLRSLCPKKAALLGCDGERLQVAMR